MRNWSPVAVWASSCAALWLAIARDPITIIFCTAATLPYTILLIRESQEQKTSKKRVV
jgi:hypothetical protein